MTRQRQYRPDLVGAAVWWTVHALGTIAVIALPVLVVVTGLWVLVVLWDGSGVHPERPPVPGWSGPTPHPPSGRTVRRPRPLDPGRGRSHHKTRPGRTGRPKPKGTTT